MGAIALETGGLLIDHGWVRVLGGGSAGHAGHVCREVGGCASYANVVCAIDVNGGGGLIVDQWEATLRVDIGDVAHLAKRKGVDRKTKA